MSFPPWVYVRVVEHGWAVNYVLIAHVYLGSRFCSRGGVLQGTMDPEEMLWHRRACSEKDLLKELRHEWRENYSFSYKNSNMSSTRWWPTWLVWPKVDVLKITIGRWKLKRRVLRTNGILSDGKAKASSAPSISSSFGIWGNTGRKITSRKFVRLVNPILGEVPLPDRLFTDASLYKRLLKRAERETN